MDEGEREGEPILLIHGFASNAATNWVDPLWVRTLTQDGRRVIAIDNRGHGQSEKLYEPERYGAPEMARDSVRLLDHLGIDKVDVLGYSRAPVSRPFSPSPTLSGCAVSSLVGSASTWCAAWLGQGLLRRRSRRQSSRM